MVLAIIGDTARVPDRNTYRGRNIAVLVLQRIQSYNTYKLSQLHSQLFLRSSSAMWLPSELKSLSQQLRYLCSSATLITVSPLQLHVSPAAAPPESAGPTHVPGEIPSLL